MIDLIYQNPLFHTVSLSSISDGARNLEIYPHKSTYSPDEQITATADGEPAASFSWTRLSGRGAACVISNHLIISASMEGSNSYQCIASNTLINGNFMSETRLFNFTVIGDLFLPLPH